MGKNMSKTPLFYHEKYREYRFGESHPFHPERFPDFVDLASKNESMKSEIEIWEAPRAEDEDLELVHPPEYIAEVYEKEKTSGLLTLDTPVLSGAPDAARMIVGGSLKATKILGDHKTVLNLGGLHHSGRSSGEGFCIFNDVAVAAQYLVNEGEKVCVYDTDAHHGNGTMDIFYDSSDVLFISIHQDPRTLYPGRGQIMEIGRGPGKGYSVNIPLPRYSTITEYCHGVEEVVRPVVEEFSPDVLIRNGGSDPHHSDSLTDLELDMTGLEYLGKTAREMAEDVDAGHVDLMVSGYGKRVTEGWQAITKGALDLDMELPPDERTGDPNDEPKQQFKETVEDLKEILSRFWNL